MPRLAGDNSHYTFVLRNDNNGRYVSDVTIALPSVTTIIGKTLAKPALVGWTYRETRDYISGAVSTLVDLGTDPADIVDCLADSDWLEEYLKSNRLRPQDTTKDAMERGHIGHALLEHLGSAYLEEDEETAQKVAQEALNSETSSGWDKGIAAWWLDRNPRVVASEKVLVSLKHGFCGSVDLIWRNDKEQLIVTDLKTRGVGKGVYESDHIQCGAYKLAWEEQTSEWVDRTTVLVAREDGSWSEEESPYDPDVFVHLVEIYNEVAR